MIERATIDPAELVAPLSEALAAEHPAARLVADDGTHSSGDVEVELERWGDPTWDPGPFDRSLGDRAWIHPVGLRVRGRGLEPARAAELLRRLLTRVQRFVDRRNVDSRAPVFERLLRRHRALHDRRRPSVRAEHDHAVDTWRWTLRLAPEAGLALQVAALFHGVERRHALASAGLDAPVIAEVEALVAADAPGDEERALLSDADALSFLSLDASSFLDDHGPSQTRARLASVLARLRPQHRARLRDLHIRHDVQGLLERELDGERAVARRRSA